MKAIHGKHVYLGDETSLKNGYIVFDNDKIVEIAKKKPDCEVVEECEVITPAFIDAHCHIGIARAGEPQIDDDTNDSMESLLFNLDVLDSIIMEDTSFQESLEAGVLYSCVLPGSANVIGGRSVLIRNYAENTREAFIKHTGLKAAFGYNPKSNEDGKDTHPSTRMGAVSLLRRMLIKGRKTIKLIEHEKKSVDEIEPKMDVVIALLNRDERLRVHAHKTDDIMAALRLADEFNLNITFEHASDVFRKKTFDLLKEKEIPLLYGPLDAFPYKVELRNENWKNAKHVISSGIKFALISDHPIVLQRMLYLQLRHLRRLGLTKEQCISKITKEPAEILGAGGLGTLAPGKLASFVCWNDDLFNLDSYPVSVFAEGKKII